jgi:hypothetical protein
MAWNAVSARTAICEALSWEAGMAIAISLVRGARERGPGEIWVRFAKCASGFILFGMGPELGSFRNPLWRALRVSENGIGFVSQFFVAGCCSGTRHVVSEHGTLVLPSALRIA